MTWSPGVGPVYLHLWAASQVITLQSGWWSGEAQGSGVGAVFMTTLSFAWPPPSPQGNLLIPQAGPDPSVTRAPDHLAPLSYWLSFQPPVSLTAGATSTWLCAVLPAPADHRTLGERTKGVEAAGCCVSALMGHQLVRALSQDGCGLVQESV